MENSSKMPRSLSELMLDLKNQFDGNEKVTLAAILEGFHERGFGFFLLIMGLFCIIPVPTFGLKSLVCLPMAYLSVQQALGRHTPWLPSIFTRQEIKEEIFDAFIDHALKWTKKLEAIARPRMPQMTQGVFSHLIGITGTFMIACIIIPLPFTNTVPAIGIILMAVGVLMRDGLAVIIGMTVGTIYCAIWFGLFFYFGQKFVLWALDFLPAFLH
jgi:hypothetical protein